MTKKLSSINSKTLYYLIVFSVGILLLLWLIQVIFLKVSYEKYQERNIKQLVNELYYTSDDELLNKIESLTFDNNTCITYIDNKGNKLFLNDRVKGCILGPNNMGEKFITEINNSSDDITGLKLVNPKNNTEGMLYGVKKSNGTIYLFTMLEDINSTSSLLKSQLIYVTIVAIILAIVISLFLSNKLSEPIVNITNKAKRLANGDFDVHFESSDISEINELSDTLNYLEKEISKTDEYRRDLMANVSHDLKTPLTMIKAYAEMVRDLTYKDDEKRNNNLNVIIEESDRLNVLVNDILELSKLQANASNILMENFDLIDELHEVLKRYEIIKETENYELITNTVDKAIVYADKKRISQVLYNLINNAINYTGEDKKVYINVIDKKKYYLVEIKDTGKGIDKSDIKYIWDKYYKKDKNHKRNVVGTGLGLSIVKNILTEHNFKYGVNSSKNKGSTFYFEIPKIKNK